MKLNILKVAAVFALPTMAFGRSYTYCSNYPYYPYYPYYHCVRCHSVGYYPYKRCNLVYPQPSYYGYNHYYNAYPYYYGSGYNYGYHPTFLT